MKNDSGGSLTWVVLVDGRVALKRGARGETQYRYFKQKPGVYTFYLEQAVCGQHRVISNVISYQIAAEPTSPAN